ncbi:hypothetical protein AJ79_00180 [Helicocarpus griseus UAMH5409]|uniref:Uncharacterized protein n=1 Tax=Helicocarpus griseus UAMH5409 TaxID=1447875 RepID=A0A2B7YDT6_9EURO|nr:hypothetical protein AJ79_00180 [Helicocarpus griseus UAMH5409]
MSDGRSNSPPSAPPRGRRPSFSDLFARPGNAAPPQPPPSGAMNVPGSIMSTANAQAQQRRRMSITTLGLSGSPTQSGPFTSPGMRRESVSSSAMSGSPSREGSVVEENENDTPMTSPTSPFARRVSFGAQVLRDRMGSGSTNGRYPSGSPVMARQRAPSTASNTSPSGNAASSAAASTHNNHPQNNKSNPPSWRPLGEGFNWPEALRTRAERAPSFGGFSPTSPNAPQGPSPTHSQHHQRSASIATMEHPIKDPREMQAQPQRQQQPRQKPKPDYFQEKILRADFMD